MSRRARLGTLVSLGAPLAQPLGVAIAAAPLREIRAAAFTRALSEAIYILTALHRSGFPSHVNHERIDLVAGGFQTAVVSIEMNGHVFTIMVREDE